MKRTGTAGPGAKSFLACSTRLRRRTCVGFLLCLLIAALSSVHVAAAGIGAKEAGFKRAGSAVRVAFEVEDVFGDRFRRALEQGGTIYVRVEAELWEARSVWDRLVRPAAVSVARLTTDAASRSVLLVDAFGGATSYPRYPRSIRLWADLIPGDRVEAGKTYYVHATVTVGTIAEPDITGASDALFGGSQESSGLGSLGRLVFQKVLRLADYLDSSSCDVRSANLAGEVIRKAPKQ